MKDELAMSLFHGAEKYNCAQAVLKAFEDECSVSQETIAAAKAFGGGRAEGGFCGALYAACSLVNDEDQIERLHQAFLAEVDFLHCREIRAAKQTPCRNCVGIAARLLDQELATLCA